MSPKRAAGSPAPGTGDADNFDKPVYVLERPEICSFGAPSEVFTTYGAETRVNGEYVFCGN
jgi:hypothetical protein